MTRELIGGSLVALVLFLAGYSAGRLTRDVTTPEVDSLRAEIKELRGINQRLEWELKQAEEESPDYPNPTSP